MDIILNNAASDWMQWMWPMAWQAAAMGAALWVISLLTRRASPRFRYWLWALLLLKVCLPPTFTMVTGAGRLMPVETVTIAAVTPLEDVPPMINMPPAVSDEFVPAPAGEPIASTVSTAAPLSDVSPAHAKRSFHLGWQALLLGAWAIGMAGLGLLVIVQHRRMARLLRHGKRVDNDRITALFEQSRKALDVSESVRLIGVPNLPSPILFGLFRPIIAIPAIAIESFPLEQLRPIVLHELAHCKRRDLWASLAQTAIQIFYWFHPAVWLANNRMRRERELIVDDLVLCHLGGGSDAYSESLLNVVKQGVQRRFLTPGYVGVIETPKHLGQRLHRILDTKRTLNGKLGWLAAGVLAALGLFLIPQARSQVLQNEAQPVKPETVATGDGNAEAKNAESIRMADSFEVRGTVFDNNSQPVEGARILLYHKKSTWGDDNEVVREVTSEKDGTFDFGRKFDFEKEVPLGEKPDTYVLIAVHPDFAVAWTNITRFNIENAYELRLAAAEPKTFTVVDENGNPLAGADVWLERVRGNGVQRLELPSKIEALSTSADEAGKATITVISKNESSCTLAVSYAGYAVESVYFKDDKPVRLVRSATVNGRVVTPEGLPVSGAILQLLPEGYSRFVRFGARTDREGRFEIRDLAPRGSTGNSNGRYRLVLRHDRYAMPGQQIELNPGQVFEGVLEASLGTPLTIRTMDSVTKAPLPFAHLIAEISEKRETVYSGATGEVTFALPPGQARVWAATPTEGMYALRMRDSGPDLDIPRTGSVLSDGEPKTLTLGTEGKTDLSVTLKASVALPDGLPAANLEVRVQSPVTSFDGTSLGGALFTRTDSAGVLIADGVPAGQPILFYAEIPDRNLILCQSLTMPNSSAVLQQPLVFQEGRLAELVLKDENGAPRTYMGLTVQPYWQNVYIGDKRKASTDEEGRLRVDGVVPGMEYFILDEKADQRETNWYADYFHTTVTLLPLEPERAEPNVLIAPVEYNRLYVNVVDPRGNVVPIKKVDRLHVVRDGRIMVWGMDAEILQRLDNGEIVLTRTPIGGAKPGDKLSMHIQVENGQYMVASGQLPEDGSPKILFVTENAQPTIETTGDNLVADESGVLVLNPKGEPVAHAKVSLLWYPNDPGNRETSTSETGVAVFKQCPGNAYIQVDAAGYAPCWLLQPMPGKTQTARLQDTARIKGRLLLADGKPASGAEIRVSCKKLIEPDGAEVAFETFPIERLCNEQGEYDIPLMPGIYDIEALSRTGYTTGFTGFKLEPGAVVSLPERIDRAPHFEIRVTDNQTGAPVAGITFYVRESARHCGWFRKDSNRVSNDQGTAIWDDLPPGIVSVYPIKSEYQRFWSDQSIRSAFPQEYRAGLDDLRFDLTRDMKPFAIKSEKGVTVALNILAPDGQPAKQTELALCFENGRTMTGDNRFGSFAGEGHATMYLPSGNGTRYAIIAHDRQGRWANAVTEFFNAKPGDKFEFTLKMTEGGQVTGRVVNAKGAPMAGVEVEATAVGEASNPYYNPRTLTDQQGRFTIRAVCAGTYQVYPDSMPNVNTRKAGTEREVTVQDKEVVDIGDLTWTARQPGL